MRPSRARNGNAYWVDEHEVMHCHGDDVVDIRLTRAEIAARRDEVQADDRVAHRKNTSSDWLGPEFRSPADVDFVVDLVRRAIDANSRSLQG